MQRIYTGPNIPKLGLSTNRIYLEDEQGNKYPPSIVAALKANPGLERFMIDFETFAGGKPPGAPQSAPRGATSIQPRGTPIRKKPGSFITVGRK